MNENQPNFESLRRLLELKRHETPPPGYFNNFSRQVMARIRDGEAEAPAGGLFANLPWLLNLLQSFETKPVFAGGFATALCGLLLFGAVMAERPEFAAQAILQPALAEVTPLASSTATPLTPPANPFLIADNSTNPVINFQSDSSVSFGQMPVNAQFTSFPVMAGN